MTLITEQLWFHGSEQESHFSIEQPGNTGRELGVLQILWSQVHLTRKICPEVVILEKEMKTIFQSKSKYFLTEIRAFAKIFILNLITTVIREHCQIYCVYSVLASASTQIWNDTLQIRFLYLVHSNLDIYLCVYLHVYQYRTQYSLFI